MEEDEKNKTPSKEAKHRTLCDVRHAALSILGRTRQDMLRRRNASKPDIYGKIGLRSSVRGVIEV